MSSHPGSDLNAAIELALYQKERAEAGAGAGFLSNARHAFHLHVLYGH